MGTSPSGGTGPREAAVLSSHSSRQPALACEVLTPAAGATPVQSHVLKCGRLLRWLYGDTSGIEVALAPILLPPSVVCDRAFTYKKTEVGLDNVHSVSTNADFSIPQVFPEACCGPDTALGSGTRVALCGGGTRPCV